MFNEFYLVKPLTSNPDSGEFYVVCKGFKGIEESTYEKLLNILDNFQVNICFFNKKDIPEEFINQVISAGPVLGVQLGKAILDSAPQAQSSMSKIFNDITTISKTGVNALSITMNQDAINVMDKFIKNFGSLNIDPIKKLTDSITALVESMAANIANAIKATSTAIGQIGTITPPNPYTGGDLTPKTGNQTTAEQVVTYNPKTGLSINVNAVTNANPQQIAQEVAWTIVNSSDANYSSINTQQGLINKIKANPAMLG
jgi:hypothetical protein